MKRFRFTQQKLLHLRRQLRRQAEMKLAQIHGRLLHNKAQADTLHRALQRLGEELSGGDGCGKGKLWRQLTASRQIQDALSRLRDEIAVMDAERLDAIRHLRERQAGVEALEALRTREWLVHRRQLAREQQRTLDETALSRWTVIQLTAARGDTDDQERA